MAGISNNVLEQTMKENSELLSVQRLGKIRGVLLMQLMPHCRA